MVRYLKRLKSSRLGRVQAFPIYGGLGMSAPSLHRESTDSLILYYKIDAQPSLVHFSSTGDYDDEIFVKTIPPSTTSRVLSQDILIENDNVNEIVQRFALVGELGPEIPDSFACFRVTFGEAECRGRVGATGIRITDNDR